MTGRCTGHCCREFVLHSGDDKVLEADRARWLAEGGLDPEIQQIMEMIIPVYEHKDKNGEGFYTTFTCRNFNAEEQQCLIYDERPEMCRRFGNEVECSYEGCTYVIP